MQRPSFGGGGYWREGDDSTVEDTVKAIAITEDAEAAVRKLRAAASDYNKAALACAELGIEVRAQTEDVTSVGSPVRQEIIGLDLNVPIAK